MRQNKQYPSPPTLTQSLVAGESHQICSRCGQPVFPGQARHGATEDHFDCTERIIAEAFTAAFPNRRKNPGMATRKKRQTPRERLAGHLTKFIRQELIEDGRLLKSLQHHLVIRGDDIQYKRGRRQLGDDGSQWHVAFLIPSKAMSERTPYSIGFAGWSPVSCYNYADPPAFYPDLDMPGRGFYEAFPPKRSRN